MSSSESNKPASGVDAVVRALRQAADEAYRVCAETRHVSLGDKARDAILALSPAATSGSEAGGIPRAPNCGRYLAEVNDGRLLYLNHAHQWQECPNFIAAALAKPSSPAGGDVREAVARAIWKFERAPENGMTEAQQDFDWRLMRGHYEECADLVLAALSPPTSAAEPVKE